VQKLFGLVYSQPSIGGNSASVNSMNQERVIEGVNVIKVYSMHLDIERETPKCISNMLLKKKIRKKKIFIKILDMYRISHY
jgi:hypothetical protein